MLRSPLSQLQEITPSKKTLKGHLRRAERLTLRHAHRFIVQRASNLREARRHALGWLLLVVSLVGLAMWQQDLTVSSYTAAIPSEGGVYSEGAVGALNNLNPILASSAAERSGSRLLFAQLLRYDDKGDLVGELAHRWHAEEGGKVYFLSLRPEARWQDGTPITADDVVFTFDMIKNADTRSPLYSSWRNVVVEKVDQTTVKFILPTPLAAFASSLTIGILPKHALADIRPAEMRTADFNLHPTVVSGPFIFQDMNVIEARVHNLLRLKANPTYVLGAPKLSGFHLHAYEDREVMTDAFLSHEVASLSDVDTDQLNRLGDPATFVQTNAPLYNATYAFLKNDSHILSDVRVRQALQHATDQKAILDLLENRQQFLLGPLLPGQLGYRDDMGQGGYTLERAQALLDSAGWVKGPDGRRTKDGQPLVLRLVTISSGDFPAVAEKLMNQWQELGITFESQLMRSEDIQQSAIAPRGYDILVYEIAIGRDPDVFAFWHSSQANAQGFNLSNYKSAKADEALESARVRLDPALRDAKYRFFLQQWIADAPAIGLYRSTLGYVENKNVVSFKSHPVVDQTDRYFDIRSWAAGQTVGRPTR
ncbi:MAG TPA: peptide ABC transporter substrate-binding protein [Candidatus Saccharimonadales bacterium]|nr:peptide ABC transporter substrate-binding protein [Candidatus Saccharimonadales bacterium]